MAEQQHIDNPIPHHIGIIMDGNGRWAKNKTQARLDGHRSGVETVSDIIKAALELKVKRLTLYTFSTENWLRPKKEITGLFGLIDSYIASKQEEFLKENIRFTCIGDLSALPKETQDSLYQLIEKSAKNDRFTVCTAINYGGRAEIVHAAKKIAQMALKNPDMIDKIDETTVASCLYDADMPDPELIIRTGGEKRVSNFLIWQAAYSEWYFTDVLWPDFKKQNFFDAIDFYKTRQRRFGMTEAVTLNQPKQTAEASLP